MKFAFVSQVLPPNWSGQSTVIYRVLSGLNPSDYCLISQDYGDAKEHRQKREDRLPGRYYYLPRRSAIMKGWRFSLIRRANIWLRARDCAHRAIGIMLGYYLSHNIRW